MVLATVGLCEAMGRLTADAAAPDGPLLVAGERQFDARQIWGGRFFGAAPHAAEIARIRAAYRAVVLKPHPAGDTHRLLYAAARTPSFLGTIGDNVCRMLALPQVAGR